MFDFTLDQIQCFQAVIRFGSFTKASEHLNRAKSAVRYSVNNLEEQLGFELLDRSKYRPVTTKQGEAFLFRAEKLLKEYEVLKTYCEDISSQVEMRLALSVSGIYNMDNVYPVIKAAMHDFPSTSLILEREILSGEQMLLNESVDMAIFERTTGTGLIEKKKIADVELLLVMSHDHQFLERPKREQIYENLLQYPQIIQRSTLPDQYNTGIHKNSIRWNVTDISSKKEIIINGLGWGRLPRYLVENEIKAGTLKHVNFLKEDVIVEIFLGRRRYSPMGKVAQFIWDSFN